MLNAGLTTETNQERTQLITLRDPNSNEEESIQETSQPRKHTTPPTQISSEPRRFSVRDKVNAIERRCSQKSYREDLESPIWVIPSFKHFGTRTPFAPKPPSEPPRAMGCISQITAFETDCRLRAQTDALNKQNSQIFSQDIRDPSLQV
eukprot:c40147_g1_i1.p1 GENE.c40147_g1_i1~~c40147_g1_i1.p1  ORF type:complete len:163 (+),score=31.19 c40147_g1_i1:43-489(+)